MKNKKEAIKKYDATVERIFKIYFYNRSFVGKNDYEKEIIEQLRKGLDKFEKSNANCNMIMMPKYERVLYLIWNDKEKSIGYKIISLDESIKICSKSRIIEIAA